MIGNVRHPGRALMVGFALLLGWSAAGYAKCLNEAVSVTVPEDGTKTKLPDGTHVVSSAKSSVGLFEVIAVVKSNTIASTSMTVNGKSPTPYEKLPSELQAVVKKDASCPSEASYAPAPTEPADLASLARSSFGSFLDFVIGPAEAAKRCTVKIKSVQEYCYGGGSCVYVITVTNSNCSSSIYVY